MKKLYIQFIKIWIIFLIKEINGLQVNYLNIDGPVENGSSLFLHCNFQLDENEKQAFTSKFYKNNEEFYRYSISNENRNNPLKKFYPLPSVKVNLKRSNGSHVFLEYIEPESEGTYSCEINTDEPFFMSKQAQQDLRVYVLPKEPLKLINVKNNYKEGETINLQCKSSPSKPPIVLRWFINNQQITKNEENLNITFQSSDYDSINGLSVSSSNLTFQFCNNYFKIKTRRNCNNRKGRVFQLLKLNRLLKIQCIGVLSQIIDKTSEELIIEEKSLQTRIESSNHSNIYQTPKIFRISSSYKVGDELELNCSTKETKPAPFLEWFVNNRRINEQFVHNYDTEKRTQNSSLINGQLIKNNKMPLSNNWSKQNSNKKKISSRKNEEIEENNEKTNFQNDYLFSNNLKRLNSLSFKRNKNFKHNETNLLDQAFLLPVNFNNLTHLFDQTKDISNLNTYHQQTLYNNIVNLTKLQNYIYQHYASFSNQISKHTLGLKFRIVKKHYQTLDYALRIKCVATYGKIILTDQTEIFLFADGHTSSRLNALEISKGIKLCPKIIHVISYVIFHQMFYRLTKNII